MLAVLEGSERAMKMSRLVSVAKMVAGQYLLFVSENGRAPTEAELLKGHDEFTFVNPETGKAAHWIFLEKAAQFALKDEPGRKVAIMSPLAFDGVRIVGLVDGGAIGIPEETVPKKYQKK